MVLVILAQWIVYWRWFKEACVESCLFFLSLEDGHDMKVGHARFAVHF